MQQQLWSQLYHPFSYEYLPGVTPFSSILYPISICAIYLILIFSIKNFMKNREPYNLAVAGTVHNVILCIWSFIMCFGMIIDLIPVVQENGFFWLLCDVRHVKVMKGRLWYWAYIYYLSKYYEFLDTILLVFKKKPLTLLHVYHHSIIVFLSWTWLQADWPLCWWAITFNTLIHVIMYYYYAASIWGYKFWWKRYLTGMQLTQFYSVFINIWIFLYVCISYSNNWKWSDLLNMSKPWYHVNGYCTGDLRIVIFSQLVNMSFIALFLDFYIKSYKNKAE